MLYDNIEQYIRKYTESCEEWEWDVFLDGIEDIAKKLFPDDKVDVWTWEVDNDTFRIDRAFEDILKFAKGHTVITYSINWDMDNENLIITIVHKG